LKKIGKKKYQTPDGSLVFDFSIWDHLENAQVINILEDLQRHVDIQWLKDREEFLADSETRFRALLKRQGGEPEPEPESELELEPEQAVEDQGEKKGKEDIAAEEEEGDEKEKEEDKASDGEEEGKEKEKDKAPDTEEEGREDKASESEEEVDVEQGKEKAKEVSPPPPSPSPVTSFPPLSLGREEEEEEYEEGDLDLYMANREACEQTRRLLLAIQNSGELRLRYPRLPQLVILHMRAHHVIEQVVYKKKLRYQQLREKTEREIQENYPIRSKLGDWKNAQVTKMMSEFVRVEGDEYDFFFFPPFPFLLLPSPPFPSLLNFSFFYSG
jgi:hypothetical protein